MPDHLIISDVGDWYHRSVASCSVLTVDSGNDATIRCAFLLCRAIVSTMEAVDADYCDVQSYVVFADVVVPILVPKPGSPTVNQGNLRC